MALRRKQLRPKMEELTAFIDETDKLIRQVAAVDQRRWTHRLLPGRLHYGINLFCIHADNIIQTVNRLNVNTGELKNRGVELNLQ